MGLGGQDVLVGEMEVEGPVGGGAGVDGVGAAGFEAVEDAFLEFGGGEEEFLGVQIGRGIIGLIFGLGFLWVTGLRFWLVGGLVEELVGGLKDGPGTLEAGGGDLGGDLGGGAAIELVFAGLVGGAAGGAG